ncbi:MAG: chitobiase/beta-hexosaminidase C-terminal domain-containing protein, partial [Desulfovibrio sp.]|nr:chitobiase/beta-hexosaminidase C-terminal domain-containing protein [Desulfovibrio sp.]
MTNSLYNNYRVLTPMACSKKLTLPCGPVHFFVMAGLLVICLLCLVVSRLISQPASTGIVDGSVPLNMRTALGAALRQERARLLRPHFEPVAPILDKACDITISCGLKGAEIHYTTDGSTPTAESPLYSTPLSLTMGNGMSSLPLKAIAIIEGEPGPVAVHTYLGNLTFKPAGQSFIFSLTTEADNLYGYENGILVPGRLRAETENIPPDPANPDKIYANYRARGRRWEKPVDVEVMAPDGSHILTQRGGLRISGGASRAFAQKSLRLVARASFEPSRKRFIYPFFPASSCSRTLPPVQSFKHLILSSGGQDIASTQIRTPLLTRLALRAGYRWAAPSAPASVHINGRFYGFSWLTPRFDAHLLASFFNKPAGDFVILDGNATSVHSSPRYPFLFHWR